MYIYIALILIIKKFYDILLLFTIHDAISSAGWYTGSYRIPVFIFLKFFKYRNTGVI